MRSQLDSGTLSASLNITFSNLILDLHGAKTTQLPSTKSKTTGSLHQMSGFPELEGFFKFFNLNSPRDTFVYLGMLGTLRNVTGGFFIASPRIHG